MLIAAIILFLIAAGFGLVVLTAILKNQPTPKPFVYIHGIIAASAVTLVIYYLVTSPASPLLVASLVLFVGAALGGLTLFTLNMKHKPIPKVLALAHPIVGILGLVTLIGYVFQ
jgi:hypothetical protein